MDNFSQYNIMQKIEELREKQRQEEEKLLRQQEEQRKLLSIKQQKLYEVLGFQQNGYEELQNHIGLQSDSTKHCSGSSAQDRKRNEVTSKKVSAIYDAAKKSYDETPAANPNADFLQLLQDKLNQQEDSNINVPPSNGKKPKKKFLRKGEGLARFRMKPKNFQPRSRTSNVEKIHHERKSELDQTASERNCSAEKKSAIDKKYDQCLKEVNRENHGFRVAANCSKPHASWTAVQRRDQYSPGKDSIENSFLEKVEQAEKKSKKELEELKVFELLEEQAQNSSFCSNSSLFARLMDDSVKSTPIKTQENTKNRHLLLENKEDILAGNCFPNSGLESPGYHPNPGEQENIVLKNENSSEYTSKLQNKKQQNDLVALNNLRVHFSDRNDYKSCSEDISDQSEEESNSTDSGETALKLSDLRNTYGDFQDDDVWSDGCGNEINKSLDCSLVTIETVPTYSKANVEAEKHNLKTKVIKPVVCSLCSELIDKMSRKCLKEIGVNTDLENDIQFQSSILQTKLQDLEKEIEIFRKENANLQKAQQQHQQEVAKFSRQKKDLENKMKEEKEQLETALQEERKKLQRQKTVIDRYFKETRKGPSKQEREEIQTLKLKIEELQEVIHKKNSKWSSFQARSREREKFLEKENRHLKEELEVFKKAKATQKAKTIKHHQISKAKVMHAINDHIAKLTPDDLEDAIVIHDVIPKKISPRFLTKIGKASTNGSSISEEVNQHEVDAPNKNIIRAQGYSGSPRELELIMQNSKTESHLSPVHLSSLDVSSQSSTEVNKQDRIKNIGSAYSGSSYFFPQPSSRKIDPETDDHSKNHELSVGKTLRSESQYDSVLSEKITDNYRVFPGSDTDDHSGSKQVTYNAQQSQDIKFNSSKSSASEVHEDHDSKFAGSLSPNNIPDNPEKCGVIEKKTAEGGREKLYPDGRKEIWYANGNVKKISADRSTSKTIFYNGDVRERLSDGTVKYYFAETKVWQTTNPDGSELMEYSNGQVELRMADGTIKTTFPDLSECTVYPDGRQKHVYKDGKVVEKNPLLETEITSYPNGQLEICSKDHMRLEYPDGTVKILYPDGLQETRYSNGRIRMKDKDGKLIMDSLQNETDSFNSQGNVT